MAAYALYDGQDPFEYHRPTEDQIERIERVRHGCHDLLRIVAEHVPPGPERTLAIRKLEEVSMWANKAIVFTKE